MENLYSEDYFMNSKFSNYKNYDERSYDQLAKDIIKVMNLQCQDVVYDYGCATGKLCYHLYKEGFTDVYGHDISDWAIKHGKEIYPDIAHHISTLDLHITAKVITCFDVLEHLETPQLYEAIEHFKETKSKYLLMRVPVCKSMGEDYVLDCSNKDTTHIQKMTKDMWIKLLESFGFKYKGAVSEKDMYDSEGVLCAVFENQMCDEVYFQGRTQMEVKHYQDAIDWKNHFGDAEETTFVLWGCGVGQRVYALNNSGASAWGYEISDFALKHKLDNNIKKGNITKMKNIPVGDVSVAYDILEHLRYEDLEKAIYRLTKYARNILVSIPFKGTPNCDNDPTHIIKESREWWVEQFVSKELKEVEVPEHFLFKDQLLIFEK